MVPALTLRAGRGRREGMKVRCVLEAEPARGILWIERNQEQVILGWGLERGQEDDSWNKCIHSSMWFTHLQAWKAVSAE